MSNEKNQRLTKNERRAQGREQARLLREAEKKREKRNRFLIQGGVALGIVAVLAVVGLVLTQTMKPAGPGPANMSSGAAIFGQDLKVVEGPRLETSDADRIAPEVDRASLPLDVTIYVDYMCPACGAFEEEHGTMLENYIGSGDIELGVYPVNLLDSQSAGARYSTRAANAFACVVNEQPDAAFDLHTRLLSDGVRPSEGTGGLDDKGLLEQAVAAGAEPTSELQRCIIDRTYGSFIANNFAKSGEALVGLDPDAVLIKESDRQGNIISMQEAGAPQVLRSTPLIIVNGKQWFGPRDGSLESYLLKVKSEIEQSQPQVDETK